MEDTTKDSFEAFRKRMGDFVTKSFREARKNAQGVSSDWMKEAGQITADHIIESIPEIKRQWDRLQAEEEKKEAAKKAKEQEEKPDQGGAEQKTEKKQQ